MTADERFAALLERYPHMDDGEELEANNIALVERSPYDGSYFVSTHDNLDHAADYRTGQEHPEDWHFVTCVALNTGNVYDEHPSVEYRQTITTFPDPEEVTA